VAYLTPLLAVPNVSEGRDQITIDMIAASWAVSEEIRLLDTHADQDHHRAVLTLAGSPRSLSNALVQGARATISRIDVMSERPGGSGQHPHVGAIDVLPVVYLEDTMRGAACAEALVIGDRIGEELGIPVFLYGELTATEGTPPRTRAELRRGGRRGLAERIASGEQLPDFGPEEGLEPPTRGL
jgi:glutamate formiminotransferase